MKRWILILSILFCLSACSTFEFVPIDTVPITKVTYYDKDGNVLWYAIENGFVTRYYDVNGKLIREE